MLAKLIGGDYSGNTLDIVGEYPAIIRICCDQCQLVLFAYILIDNKGPLVYQYAATDGASLDQRTVHA